MRKIGEKPLKAEGMIVLSKKGALHVRRDLGSRDM
jgi:hypothetical protein